MNVLRDRLKKWMDRVVEAGDMPFGAASVSQRGKEMHVCSGIANDSTQTLADPQTIGRFFSMTKIITSFAVVSQTQYWSDQGAFYNKKAPWSDTLYPRRLFCYKITNMRYALCLADDVIRAWYFPGAHAKKKMYMFWDTLPTMTSILAKGNICLEDG